MIKTCKSFRFYLILIILFAFTMGANAQGKPIGINLTGIQDWSPEFSFVNVMNQSREWIAHDIAPGSPWSSEVNIPLGINGYPLEIPYDNGVDAPQGIRTLMFFGEEIESTYPDGTYTLRVDGTGTIQLWGGASGTFTCPINTTVTVNNDFGGIGLEILESQAHDPIHNIRVIMPGFENSFETNPFHPNLLSFLEDFSLIRFMDWMSTNGSLVSQWSDRNTLDNYTQAVPNGVAYEHIIALCNELQTDAWINIPHQANDNFIIEFARLFRDLLDPNLKIYVEYSNETWNGIFPQNQYTASQGLALGYSGEPWERTWKYTAKRSADIFQIFEDEFADDSRFIKVIPGFSATPWVTNYIIERFNEPFYNPTQIGADAVAIAPYFGGGIADDIGNAGMENTITVQEILDELELSLPESYTAMSETKTVANTHNLDLIAYEGGQHLVAYWPYSQNESYVEKLLDANRDPRMEGIYCAYFNHWYNTIGGDMFAYFSSHGGYSQYGAWGLKETYDDVSAPKYLAIQNCVFNSSPLSVELLDFWAYKTNKHVNLEWETANEINNKGFEIQRSSDGKDWQTIGFSHSKESSNETNQYQYLDTSPLLGVNYYRLKQIDFDESFEYFEVITIRFFSPENQIQVYPNPSNKWVNIEIDNPSNQQLKVVISDQLGRKVWENSSIENTSIWKSTVEFKDTGLFFIKIVIGNDSFYNKVIISGEE